MKKTLLIIQILLCTIAGFTQTQATSPSSPESITLVTLGDGKNKNEAINVALRSAIEQTFGTFVSANTSILNDELIKDEIVSISSGNIEDYKELDYQVLPDGRSTVTLQATVSINKLVSYAQAKGSSCELNSSAFIAQLNYKKLQKESIKKAWEHYTQMRLEKVRNCVTEVTIKEIKMREAIPSDSGVFVIIDYAYKVPTLTDYYVNIDHSSFLEIIGPAADYMTEEDWNELKGPFVVTGNGIKLEMRRLYNDVESQIVCRDNLGWTERLCFSDYEHNRDFSKYCQNLRWSNNNCDSPDFNGDLGEGKGSYTRYYPMKEYEKLTNISLEINNNVNDYLKDLKEYYDRQINSFLVCDRKGILAPEGIEPYRGWGCTSPWLASSHEEIIKLYNYKITQYVKKCKNHHVNYYKELNHNDYYHDDCYKFLSEENKKLISDELSGHKGDRY